MVELEIKVGDQRKMARIFYKTINKMTHRPGVNYATEYLVQDFRDRLKLKRHIASVIADLAIAENKNPALIEELKQPLKAFPKSVKGQYYSAWEIIEDMYNEAVGKKRDGTPKDFAMAPIGRWNKLFANTERTVDLEEQHKRSQYGEMFE